MEEINYGLGINMITFTYSDQRNEYGVLRDGIWIGIIWQSHNEYVYDPNDFYIVLNLKDLESIISKIKELNGTAIG